MLKSKLIILFIALAIFFFVFNNYAIAQPSQEQRQAV
jgi:hypothetical protein